MFTRTFVKGRYFNFAQGMTELCFLITSAKIAQVRISGDGY